MSRMGKSAAPHGPVLAKFSLPGCFFMYSTASRNVFHGASPRTAKTAGLWLIRATGTNWSGPIGAFWTSAKIVFGPVPPKSSV